jgi:hypothetical protein
VKTLVASLAPTADATWTSTRGAVRAFVDAAAADVAGTYLRISPSRAWRERYARDCRRVATTLCRADAKTSLADRSKANAASSRRRAAIARTVLARGALLRAGSETIRVAVEDVATHAASGFGLVVGAHVEDETTRSAGHSWGAGPSPEALWRLREEEAERDDGDPWAWMPRRARWGGDLDDDDDDDAWDAAEAEEVRTAPMGEIHAAVWRRSELLEDDITPLEPGEEAAKKALLAAVNAHR